ncbi:DUF5681 domain-containing protein [uncultured Sneathiella sp.]|jgi:hypothetical protein|uniref:DUF5681 domain-containing protein n=1 Tax=uncultured Sneathiella sp. TaxID=879315 RepID=UPI0030DC1083|tara:strand:+ start:45681 stop:46253 length:573 start_codon:yes stop_codon:yes gene_type:complete
MNDKPTRGNPPVSGRFKPGQSGNPKGRPKSKVEHRSVSAINVIMDKTVTVNRNGKLKEIKVEEALQQRTFQDALDGNRMAQREILKWIVKRDKYLAAENRKKSPKAVALKYTGDPSNADDALLLLKVTALDPRRQDFKSDRPQMLLEPWAVQMAMGKRRGVKKLTEKQTLEIQRCTRDSDSLKWPRGTRR